MTTTQAVDWRDVPRGYYAIPTLFDDGTLRGYHLFERKTPRIYKSGRTVGRDDWVIRYVSLISQPLVGPSQPMYDKVRGHAPRGGYESTLFIFENLDLCRETFGRLTGHCGYCGKALTDPDSKMRGIGPECAKGIR